MKPCTMKESIRISRCIERGDSFDLIFPRWSRLKNRLKRKCAYVSKKDRERIYGCQSRIDQIRNREDLASLLVYYSDRWHACRIYTFDEAFKKIKKIDDLNEFIWRPILRKRNQYKEKAYFKKYGMTMDEAMMEYGRYVLLTDM